MRTFVARSSLPERGGGVLYCTRRRPAIIATDIPVPLVTGGPQPAVLQEVNIPVWTNAECRQKYGNAAPGGIVDTFLCAGQASRDSCSVSIRAVHREGLRPHSGALSSPPEGAPLFWTSLVTEHVVSSSCRVTAAAL